MMVSLFHVFDNYIVFVKCFPSDAGFITQLCRYNIASKKLSVIENIGYNGYDGTELFIGSLRYYRTYIYYDATEMWEGRLCRMDVFAASPADTVLMADVDMIPDTAYLAFTLDNRIYLSDGSFLYSVSKDLTDVREVCTKAGSCTDGEYIYYSTYPSSRSTFSTTIWYVSEKLSTRTP